MAATYKRKPRAVARFSAPRVKATPAPKPGQPGWNPFGSYAKPISETPAVAGSFTPPPDPAWMSAQATYNRNRGNLTAEFGDPSLKADAPFAQRYGYQGVTAQREFGFDDAGGIDPNNPYGRAQLLEKSYKQSQRGTGTSMAARGQLYSGARQSALDEGTRQYGVSSDALSKAYQGRLHDISQQATTGIAGLDDFLGSENAAYAGRVSESAAAAGPTGAAPAAKTYHPVVQRTMDQAKQLWSSGQKKGTKWRDIISILGYDPRAGGALSFR